MSSSFSFLPSIRTLPISRRTLLVSRLCVDQHVTAFELIVNAAQRGDNIGSDEFPTLDKFNQLMTYSEGLAISDVEDKRLECLILVSPCKPVRSVHPAVCSVHIITSKSMAHKMIWKDLAQLSESFICHGLKQSAYSAVVTYVFITCVDRMLAMRESGFLITACVPLAGVLEGYPGRHCHSYIMHKDLGVEHLAYPFVPDSKISVLPITVIPSSLPTVDYLPFDTTLQDGIILHVRQLLVSDIAALYEAFTAEIRQGTGYGLDELPTLEFFRYRYVNEWCTLVFELSNDVKCNDKPISEMLPVRQIVAYANFGPSSYARSVHPVIADVNVIILPKWRGRKWSLDIMKVCLKGIASSGYLGVQGEASVDNVPSIRMMLATGFVVNGTLPMGIFYKNVGWVDSNMSYIPLSVIQQII